MHSAVDPSDVHGATLQSLARPLLRFGYRITSQGSEGVTFYRSYRPWWIRLLALITFPIGLAFLFFKREETLTMSFERDGSGTRIVVTGDGPRKVRRAFAEIATSLPV